VEITNGLGLKYETRQLTLIHLEAIEMGNDTSYGLACGVFSQNTSRCIRVAHALEAGTAWVSSVLMLNDCGAIYLIFRLIVIDGLTMQFLSEGTSSRV